MRQMERFIFFPPAGWEDCHIVSRPLFAHSLAAVWGWLRQRGADPSRRCTAYGNYNKVALGLKFWESVFELITHLHICLIFFVSLRSHVRWKGAGPPVVVCSHISAHDQSQIRTSKPSTWFAFLYFWSFNQIFIETFTADKQETETERLNPCELKCPMKQKQIISNVGTDKYQFYPVVMKSFAFDQLLYKIVNCIYEHIHVFFLQLGPILCWTMFQTSELAGSELLVEQLAGSRSS